MANGRLLQGMLAPGLKRAGFARSGATWRRPAGEAIAVVNVQGSKWGPSFYINLGVWLRVLGGAEQPQEQDCHVRTRLNELVPDRERLRLLLDLGADVPADDRARELEALVTGHGLPWLERVSTLAGARAHCRTLKPGSPWVARALRGLLEAGGENG